MLGFWRRKSAPPRGFMARLGRDVRGNTLAIMAAAIIPILGLSGSAIDISRSYMVKVRLQQACDAGALAARKAMDSNSLSQAAHDEGDKLFNFNFANGVFGATNTGFTPAATSDGQITATATTRVPMTIMKIFGQQYADLNVRCDARLEIANTDVMLVLDVTGSMADCPDDSICNSGPNSKIVALRDAVVQFFNTVNSSTSGDARFRIGFVPYSSAVNVGDLLQSSWLVNSWTYQSRVANMTTVHRNPTVGTPTVAVQTYSSTLNSANCNIYAVNKSYTTLDGATFTSGTAPSDTTVTTYSFKDWGATGTTTGTKRTCRRNVTTTVTSYPIDGYTFTDWTYKPVTYSLTNYAAGNTVNVYAGGGAPTGLVPNSGEYDMVRLVNTAGSTVPATASVWGKCIEERDTLATTTSPYFDAANSPDMDINTIPSGQSTQWRPMWPKVVYDRGSSSNETNVATNRAPVPNTWCPVASSKLATSTTADVQAFVNGLIPNGNTYHDYGMSWGVRLMSPHGLFASENGDAPNGKPVSRHIIFMTDGIINTPNDTYGGHGYEKLDRRVSGTATASTANLNTRHTQRFLAYCNAARTENVTVWTVAFGTSNPSSLLTCANNDTGKSFVATDGPQLRAKFQQIASQISELRLSQ